MARRSNATAARTAESQTHDAQKNGAASAATVPGGDDLNRATSPDASSDAASGPPADKSIDETIPPANPGLDAVASDASSQPPTEEPPRADGETVIVELPIGEAAQVTWGLHIDTRLSAAQANALRRIAAGLDRAQATLDNGRRVVNHNDAIKYLLEMLAESA